MILTLEPLRAQEGDCLLLHWGTKATPRLAVIDGGPGRVYEDSLEPRLEEIRANRKVDRLTIDLVMVSHIDNDHIVGIKKLFRALKSEVDKNTPDNKRPFKAERLWHNAFNDILGDGIADYYKSLTASLTASVGGQPNRDAVDKIEEAFKGKGEDAEEAREKAYDIGLILAGHGEGRELRDNHNFLYKANEIAALNHPFKKNGKPTLITAEMTPEPVKVAGLLASRDDVDALGAFLESNGMTVLDPPGEYYGRSYYAVYFADPDGMKLEAMVFKPPKKKPRERKKK